MKYSDLHMHTSYSDGDYDIEDVIKMAKDAKFEVISITDHDRCDHYELISKIADEYAIRLIKGIELSAYDFECSKKVHIIGLFLPEITKNIDKLNLYTNKKRNAYHISLLDKLREDGFDLSEAYVKKFAPNSIIYKSNIYWAMKAKYPTKMQGVGYKDIFDEKTDDELAKKIGYVDVEDAIKAVNEDGGLPILAHPQEYNNWDEIPKYIDFGLKGIEINHSRMKEGDFQQARDFADKYNLLKSGGSDFHRLGKFKLGEYGLDEQEFHELEKGKFDEYSNT